MDRYSASRALVHVGAFSPRRVVSERGGVLRSAAFRHRSSHCKTLNFDNFDRLSKMLQDTATLIDDLKTEKPVSYTRK